MAATAGRLARRGISKGERAHATGEVAWGLWCAGTQRLCAPDFFQACAAGGERDLHSHSKIRCDS
jgi:hypothetical protein